MLKKVVLILMLTSLFGCASVPMDTAENDAKYKQFQADPDRAGIYVYRNETFGAAMKLDVEVDGKKIGETAAHTYFYQDLEPGKHTITSKGENTETLTLDAIKGKLYYIWQEVKMGVLSARTKLTLMDDEEGKKGVLECKAALAK
jgi:hypothetical protein